MDAELTMSARRLRLARTGRALLAEPAAARVPLPRCNGRGIRLAGLATRIGLGYAAMPERIARRRWPSATCAIQAGFVLRLALLHKRFARPIFCPAIGQLIRV